MGRPEACWKPSGPCLVAVHNVSLPMSVCETRFWWPDGWSVGEDPLCSLPCMHLLASGITTAAEDLLAPTSCVVTTAVSFLFAPHSLPVHPAGVLITAVDSFLLLLIERCGVRNLEALFGVLVGIMAISFGIMFVDAGVPAGQVVEGAPHRQYGGSLHAALGKACSTGVGPRVVSEIGCPSLPLFEQSTCAGRPTWAGINTSMSITGPRHTHACLPTASPTLSMGSQAL